MKVPSPDKAGEILSRRLKQEIELHVNERLYETGVISKEVYEEAKVRIVKNA